MFKLLQRGVQLYTTQPFAPLQPYQLTEIPSMDIAVWLFNLNIDIISKDLRNLYGDLKDYATFTNKADWVNYYINRLALNYRKQSQQDLFMGQNFVFFRRNMNTLYGAYFEYPKYSPRIQRNFIE